MITIDAEQGILSVDLSAQTLAERKEHWQQPELSCQKGVLWKYAQAVGSAENGAVTHPGTMPVCELTTAGLL
jgi:dihydroxy-acid dehydratase